MLRKKRFSNDGAQSDIAIIKRRRTSPIVKATAFSGAVKAAQSRTGAAKGISGRRGSSLINRKTPSAGGGSVGGNDSDEFEDFDTAEDGSTKDGTLRDHNSEDDYGDISDSISSDDEPALPVLEKSSNRRRSSSIGEVPSRDRELPGKNKKHKTTVTDEVESSVTSDSESELTYNAEEGCKGFATAFNTIMTRRLPVPAAPSPSKKAAFKAVDLGTDTSAQIIHPILSERRELLEEISQRKAQWKASARAASEKKALFERSHVEVKFDPESLNHEKSLKRTATKGVVRLFNAILDYRRRQMSTDKESTTTTNAEKRQKVAKTAKSSGDVIKKAACKPAPSVKPESDSD